MGASRAEYRLGGRAEATKFVRDIDRNYRNGITGADIITGIKEDGTRETPVEAKERMNRDTLRKTKSGALMGADVWTQDDFAPTMAKEVKETYDARVAAQTRLEEVEKLRAQGEVEDEELKNARDQYDEARANESRKLAKVAGFAKLKDLVSDDTNRIMGRVYTSEVDSQEGTTVWDLMEKAEQEASQGENSAYAQNIMVFMDGLTEEQRAQQQAAGIDPTQFGGFGGLS